MAAKLLPCPFCGGSADEEVIIDGSDLSKVYCTNPECGGGSKRHIHQQSKCAMLPCLGYLESECEDCVNYNLYRKP